MLVTLCEPRPSLPSEEESGTVGKGEVGLKEFPELKAAFGYAASGEIRLPGNETHPRFLKGTISARVPVNLSLL